MRNALIALMIFSMTSLASAELITFLFRDGTGTEQTGNDLDGLDFGTSIMTGSFFTITLTATSIVSGSTGAFNLNVAAFGINATGAGDVTDSFDNGLGTESMVFEFDRDATFVSAGFNRITGSGGGGDDIGNLSFSLSGLSTNFHELNTAGIDEIFTVNQAFSAGEEITLSYVDGNGFGLESITVDVIPEPTSVALLGMGTISLFVFGRRRRTPPHLTD